MMAFALGVVAVATGAIALASAANAARGSGPDDMTKVAKAFGLIFLALAAAFWAGRIS